MVIQIEIIQITNFWGMLIEKYLELIHIDAASLHIALFGETIDSVCEEEMMSTTEKAKVPGNQYIFKLEFNAKMMVAQIIKCCSPEKGCVRISNNFKVVVCRINNKRVLERENKGIWEK